MQTYPSLPDLYAGLAAENDPNDVLIIPHAHQPGDWRQTNPDMERLVEIVSNHGTFEWFGRYYLANGAELGFVGGSDDHNSHPGLAVTRNDIQNRSGILALRAPQLTTDAIFDALRDKRSYATTGAHILMDVNVNGTEPGRHAPFSPERRIQARISGTAPLSELAIIKNGKEIWTRNLSVGQASGDIQRIRINLESSSEPFKGQFDFPRGWHVWKGTIKVEGATLVDVKPEGLHNRFYYARLAAADPSTVEFSAKTRGYVEGFILEVKDISPSARLAVHVETTQEIYELPYKTRKPNQLLDGADFAFALAELAKAPAEHVFKYEDFYADVLSAHFDDGKPVYDISIDETDRDTPRAGDTYYVRAMQVDGHTAWSSAVWVGTAEKKVAAPTP